MIARLLMIQLVALLIVTIGFVVRCNAKMRKVAVLDTGIHATVEPQRLCKYEHKDFTGEGLHDKVGHGTNVAGLISRHLPANYCIVVIKAIGKNFSFTAYYDALKYVDSIGVDYLNLSIAGQGTEPAELNILKRLLDQGVKIVAASGNDSKNFAKTGCIIYPACADPRIYVVSAKDVLSANIGPQVDLYMPGARQTAGGYTLTGTSQAAANATAHLIRKLGGKK